MKIVMIEDFFHPEAGYQCNILSRYLTAFGHEVIIVTSEMDKMPQNLKIFFGSENIEEKDKILKNKSGINVIRIPLIKHVSGRSIYDRKIFKIVDDLKPDILYVHGNDTYIGIRYILRQRKLKYPIITDNHMIEIATKNKFSKYFKLFYKHIVTPKIREFNTPIIRTINIDFVMKHYGIPLELAPVIGFGSDTILFHEDDEVRKGFRKELNISEDAFVCVYAGKLDESKGGLFLAESIKEKLQMSKELYFVIVGNTSGEYGKKTEEVFSQSENRIIRFPTQKYIDLPKYFQIADITVYPKQCSLSFYDSTACGAPALVEDNEIGLQRSKECGCLKFKAGDKNDFREKIVKYANLPDSEIKSIKQEGIDYIISNYNYEEQARKYEELLIQTVKEYRKI